MAKRVIKSRSKTPFSFAKPSTPQKPEAGLDRRQIIAELAKTPHGQLEAYQALCMQAASEDPGWFGHLLAWNALKGEVRDAKQALPVIALKVAGADAELQENALAHLAALDPRSLTKALRFAKTLKGGEQIYRRFVVRYLRNMEQDRGWSQRAVQHRVALKTLYAWWHVKPGDFQRAILWDQKYPPGSAFEAIAKLKTVTPQEAAALIVKHKLPDRIVASVLGKTAANPELLTAWIASMTPAELVNNAKRLEKLGVKKDPAARAAFEAALKKATESKRAVSSLKATKAAEVLESEGEEILASKLRALQERQFEKLGGVEGDWLVLGDRSGSMKTTIEVARQISAVLARMVKGKIYLVFFDNVPEFYDVTGKSYEDIKKVTARIAARGGTSIGCGLQAVTDKKLTVDGITIVSDGGENEGPTFASAYQRYVKTMGNEPTVYFYEVDGDSGSPAFKQSLKHASIDFSEFNLRGQTVDYYSLPNLVQTMRVGRYQLFDEINETPFLTLDEVLTRTKGQPVVIAPQAVLQGA